MTDTMKFADMSGKTIYDRDGVKIGEVSQLWLDDVTGQPDWVTVRTGLFGMSESFLPCDGLRGDNEGHLRTSYPKQQVKDAPTVHPDAGHLERGEENRLYQHYGITSRHQRGMTPRHGDGTVPGQRVDPTPPTGKAGRGESGTVPPGQRAAPAHAKPPVADQRPGSAPNPGRDQRANAAGKANGANGADGSMTRSEEHLKVGVESHETGRVRLHKYVVTETETVEVPVTKERVTIERVPITEAGQPKSAAEIAEADYEVTLHEQRPVVRTETVAVERVRLGTEEYTETQKVSGEVRKERIDIEGDVDDQGSRR